MNTIHLVSSTSLVRSSEAVAVRKSFSFRSLMMRVMLVVGMMMIGIGAVKADSYTITFKTGSGDGTSITTSTACSTIVSAGSSYLSGNVVTATNVYYSGGSGLKLGKSGGAGTIKMNLSALGQVTPTSIVVSAKRYNTSKSATLKVNGSSTQTINNSSSFNNYTFDITTSITYIELVSSQYIWISSITVNYTAAPSYTITAQSSDISLGTVSLSGTTITATPNDCVEYDSPAYSITSGAASVRQSGNSFTVTPSSDCTVRINFAEKETYNVTWNVNGSITSKSYCEGTIIPAGDVPAPTSSNCDGSKVFVGWTTHSDYYNLSEAPDDLRTNLSVTVTSDVTYFAVFAVRDIARYEETLIQTLQYDTWSYSGSTTNKPDQSYRLFHAGSYIQSAEFDLSKLSKVIVYGGTFGGALYNSLTIGDGTNTWKDVTVSGNSQTGENIYTDGAALSGTGRLRITSNSGTDSDHGVRISKVEIYAMTPVHAYTNYTTDCSHSDKFFVIYDANGAEGDVPEDNNEYYSGDYATVLAPGNLSMEGFFFDRWNTAANGSGTNYRIGDEIEVNANVRLYAMWIATISWLANGLALTDYDYSPNEYVGDNGPQDDEAEEYACTEKHFVGWAESEFEERQDRPTIMTGVQIAGLRVTGEKIYYAVYATVNPNDAPLNTILWSETWDGGTSGTTPGGYAQEGTSVYNDESLSYSQSGAPYIRDGVDDHYAGGTVPELLLPSSGAWIISNIPTGGAYQMLFTFKSNHENFNLTTSTDNVTISGSEKIWTITISGNVTNFNLTLTNTSSSNVRIDDVELKIIQISATADNYTTFCPCNYGLDLSDGDMVWAGKNGPTNGWNSKSNWVVYNSSDSKYHLATSVPTESSNVFIINKRTECDINVKPLLTSDVTCNNITLSSNMGINLGEYDLTVTGNFTNDGSAISGDGSVIFAGTSAQAISGATTFNNVEFNNSNGITASTEPTINGTATFTNGVINGNVTFGSGATVSASTSSYVNGKVTKNGMSGAFTFPTGTASLYAPFEASSSTASNVSVQYATGSEGMPDWWNHSGNLYDAGLHHASDRENWKISASATTVLSNIKLCWNAAADNYHSFEEDASDLKSYLNVAVVKKGGFYWQNLGKASIDGSFTGAGSITAAEPLTITVGAKAAGDGEYFATFASSNGGAVVLPIELTSFTANCNGKSSLIEWTTATEKNNDFFVLERSSDAINFKEIARVAGAGNSIEPLNYAYTDYGARSGDNYYRLVQVDYDGTSTASEIIVANCPAENLGEPDVLAFPNPFDDNLTLHFENFGNVQATIEVYDMLGRMVQTQKVNCSQNDYEVVLRLAGLSDGTYNVRISTKELVINRQVVKQ